MACVVIWKIAAAQGESAREFWVFLIRLGVGDR